MKQETLQLLFNLGLAGFVIGSGVISGWKNRGWIKELGSKIPENVTSNDTLESKLQDQRDRLNRELGVEMDKLRKEIKELQEVRNKDQKRITELEASDTRKDSKINEQNALIASLSKDMQEEKTARENAEKKASELNTANAELKTKVAVLEGQVALLNAIQATPTPIRLIIENASNVVVAENKSTPSNEKVLE